MLGCFFHFGDFLYKKICDFGLRQENIDNAKLRNWFKRMLALAMVPLDEIKNVYINLIDEASELFEISIYSKLEQWIDFFSKRGFLMERMGQISKGNVESFYNNGPRTNNNNEAINLRVRKN